MDAFKKGCDLWMLAELVSVYQVLHVVNDDMFKKMFNVSFLFNKKDTEKVVLSHCKWMKDFVPTGAGFL